MGDTNPKCHVPEPPTKLFMSATHVPATPPTHLLHGLHMSAVSMQSGVGGRHTESSGGRQGHVEENAAPPENRRQPAPERRSRPEG